MPSLQHVRLHSHKGLKGATLNDLQKINIVCGPNNSGKTTVLECIANPKLCTIGLTFPGDVAKSIAKESAGGFGWGSGNPHLDDTFIRLVEEALASQPAWFADEIGKLLGLINWRQHFGNWDRPIGNLEHVFTAKFTKPPSTVLVPAKRRLETLKVVQAADAIQPDGTGVLNFLFAAKNQHESSQARQRFERICSGFTDISAGYEFEVFLLTNNHVELLFRRKGGSWIQAVDCGLGLQDLLIILHFALASDYDVILIEEPENHLHPEIQRRLINYLRDKTEKQFFLSTHSSVFLSTQFADRVFLCRLTGSVSVENATNRAAMLTELGYSIADNLVSDLVVLCEGPTDKVVLEEFFRKKHLPERFNIKVWPLGGDIMDQLDLTVFGEAYRVVALLDADPGSSKIRKNFLVKCAGQNLPVHQLQRYALENYFTVQAISAVMGGHMPAGVAEIDPEKRVSDQLGFEVKKNGGRIAKEMSLEDIKGTDLESFLEQVESLACQGRSK